MELTKQTIISEEEFEKLVEGAENSSEERERIFSYITMVNVPKENKEDAIWAAFCETDEINEDGNIDLPVEVRYISYSQDATCYRVKFQSGKERDYI